MKRTPDLRSVTGFPRIFAAFVRREVREDISYPMSLLLSEFTIIFPIFIWLFVSQLVPASPAVGDDYFTFAVVGLAVSTILQASLAGFGGSLQRAQNRGTFETLLVEPIPWLSLPFLMNSWRILLGIVNGIALLALGAVFGASYVSAGIPAFALVLVLGIAATTGIGIVSASLMVLAKRADPVLTLYGLAASLLGGALFSVDQLPAWLKAASWLIPHTYVINASRAALTADPGSFVITVPSAVVALAVFNVAVFTLGLWLFHRAMLYARDEGLLAGY